MRGAIRAILRTAGLDVRRAPPVRRWGDAVTDVTVVGPYLIHNFGDDLIGAVFARRLQRAQGAAIAIPGFGSANAHWLGLTGAGNYAAGRRPRGDVLIGGGGLLGDSGRTPSDRYIRQALDAAQATRRRGGRVVVAGIGAGPLAVPAHREVARALCTLAEAIGVRDEPSARFVVDALGQDPAKVARGADVALLWPDYLDVTPVANGLVGLQCDIDGYVEPAAAARVTAAFALYARRDPGRVCLVSNSARPTGLAAATGVLAPRLEYASLPAFLPHLAGLRGIVTTHLHLSIAAFAQRIPCFSVYVNEKTRRFYAQIGRPGRALDARTATAAQIAGLLDAAGSAVWEAADDAALAGLRAGADVLLALTDRLGPQRPGGRVPSAAPERTVDA